MLITDDFVSQVNKYVDYCRPIIDAAELVEVESRVNLTRVLHHGRRLRMPAPGGGLLTDEPLQTFGTADFEFAVMPDGMLIVGDTKTGRRKGAGERISR